MSAAPLAEGVTRTALGVARARALESARPDRLFADPYAAAFVAAAEAAAEANAGATADAATGDATADAAADAAGDAATGQTAAAPTSPEVVEMLRHLAVRTRFFDDFLLRAATDGCRQIVIPAAGLDTRAYRLNWPAGVVCYELDLPALLTFKERVLTERAAVPAARRVALAVDLRTDWAAVLRSAGFDQAERSAWLIEGLLIYLEPAAAARLLDQVGELAAPGSRLALTHGFDPRAGAPRAAAGLDRELAAVDALWRGGLEEELVPWLAAHGWRAAQHDRAVAAVAYGRPADYLSPRNSFVVAERTAPA